MTLERVLGPEREESVVLVEGPAWADAGFYGRWLLTAANANELLKRARIDDPAFSTEIATLELIAALDFGIMGTVFVSQFVDREFETYTVDTASKDILEFSLMAEMGFFELTGDRYQMTLPSTLTIERVKQAHRKLAATDDDEWIHPERLVVSMTRTQAVHYQRLLRAMEQGARIADRKALLFLD